MKASKASFLSRALSLVAAASIFVQGPVAVAMECDGKVWFEIADKRKGKVNVEKQLANTEEKLKQLEAGNAPVPPAKSVAAKEAQATSVIGEKLQGELNALGLKAATRNSSTKVDAPGPGLKEIESGLVKGFEKESGGMYNIRNGARVEGSIKQGGAQPHFVTDFHTSPKLAPLRDFARGLKEANVPQEEKIGRIVEFIQRKALVGKSYGDRKYNQLLAQYRNAGKDIPLSAYMDCKAGVCRENALYTHFALKEAGVDNLYVYANVKQRNRILGRALTEQNEDHAFVIVKHKGDDYIVDSYNENFHGYSFSQLKDPALTPSTKLKRAEYAGSPDPFTFRAVNKVNPFPAVWQPLDEIDGAKALSRASATLIKETPSTAARDAERIARGAFKNEAEFAESVKEIRKLNAGIRGARDSYVWNRFDALREVVTKAKEEQYRAEGVVKHLMAKENDIGKIQKNPAYIEAKAFDRFVVEAENRLARMPQPPAKAAESVRASGPRSFKIGTKVSTIRASSTRVNGRTVVPPSLLKTASPEISRAGSFAGTVRAKLRDAGNTFLKTNNPADFERYQDLARRFPQFEPPLLATSTQKRRAELLRRELSRLQIDEAEAKAELALNPSEEAGKRLDEVIRTQAAVALQKVGEAEKKLDPKLAKLERQRILRRVLGDDSLAKAQGELGAKSMRDIATGADAGLLRSVRDKELLESAEQSQATRRLVLSEVEKSLASGDSARARKMATDIEDLHAGATSKEKLVKDRGWSRAQADQCFETSGLCRPSLSVRKPEEVAEEISPLAQKILYEEELAKAFGEGAELAREMALPGSRVEKGDPIKAAMARLSEDTSALTKELKATENKPALAAQASDLKKAKEALESRLNALRAEEKLLSGAKPLGFEAQKLDNSTVNDLMGVLSSYDSAALKAKIGEAGVLAKDEGKGFEQFAMKGISKGDDRLALYQKMKTWMKEADASTAKKIDDFLADELSKKPGYEKIKVGAESDLATIQKSRELARATGVSDGRVASAVQSKAGVSEQRQSLLRVTGANADETKSILETTAEAQARTRKVEADAIERIAKREEGSKEGRVLASVTEPKKIPGKLDTDQIAKVAADELKILADKSGARALDEATQRAIVNAAKEVEQGGTESAVRLGVARIAAFADNPDMFDSAKEAYLGMARALEKNPGLRSKPNWREEAMRTGVEEMLRKSGFDSNAIHGKPPEEAPGMLARTVACLKL